MNYILVYFSLFMTMFLLSTSCSTTKVCPEKYDQAKIYFGDGGGFTGKLNEYCVLDNGEVYKVNPSSREATLRSTISKSKTKSLFKNINSLELSQYPYDTPGNMFCWLKYHNSNDTTYLIWNDHDKAVSENVTNIYEQLVTLTKQQ